jgi:predicted  nucleic acid-binding Zn-ribbon protein
MATMKADNEKQVLNVMTTGAQSLNEVKTAMTASYEKLLLDEREKCARMSKDLQEANERITALETEMPIAVQDAKKKVYEKAQAQFAAGNKEFLKIKNTLKETVSAKEECDKKIASLEASLQGVTAQLSAAHTEKDRIKQDMDTVNACLEGLMKADITQLNLKSMTGVEYVEAVLCYYREKSGDLAQQVSTANKDKAEKELAMNELKDKITAADLSIKTLKDSLVSAEAKLTASNDAIASAKRENQSQLVLVANLISEKGRIETDLTIAKRELESISLTQSELTRQLLEANGKVVELTTTCDGLRAMNKDCIEMLEAMYAKERE